MSVLSLLTSVVLVGLVYGLSFLPTATLTWPDDDAAPGISERIAASDDARDSRDQA